MKHPAIGGVLVDLEVPYERHQSWPWPVDRRTVYASRLISTVCG